MKFVLQVFISLQLVVGGYSFVYGQNNALVINGAYINIANGTFANPIYMVVNNGTPAAITRTTGHIISEQEGNFVRWITNNVAVTTNYVFPFGFSNTDYLPVTIHKTSVGVVNNASSIDMSTWATPNTNLTWATSVTNMTGTGGANATNSVIDRWWQIVSLATVTGTADFSYRGTENTTVYPVGPFSGQEWDIPSSSWMTPATGTGAGVTGAAIGTSTGIVLGGRGLGTSTPYILSATVAPLPIELVSFTAACDGTKTHIKWTTASETNVANIELQKSDDMNAWTTIYVAAPSNSSTTAKYNYTYTETGTNTVYYRLQTNNYDGGADLSAVIFNHSCSANNTLSAFYSDNTLNVFSRFDADAKVTYTLYDIAGNKILTGEYTASSGSQLLTLPVNELSNAIYLFRAESNTTYFNQKIIIAR